MRDEAGGVGIRERGGRWRGRAYLREEGVAGGLGTSVGGGKVWGMEARREEEDKKSTIS